MKPNPVPICDRRNLQPWSVEQALPASTHPKGQMHLEPYLNSSVTLCLQKGVKNLCRAGFLLRFLPTLPLELLRQGGHSLRLAVATAGASWSSRTTEHEKE